MICNVFRHSSRAGWLLGVALVGWSASASAYTISLTGGSSGGNPGGQPLYEVSGLVQGDAFNVSWGGVAGLNVTGMVIIDSLTATTADIRVMLDNNSTQISGDDPRITSMGLLIEDYTSLATTATGGTYLDLEDDSNFPGIAVDVCGTSGNNCSGGGSGGVPAGDSDDFTLQVNGTFASVLTLSNFGLKIQGGPGGNSFELAGVPTLKVPESASISLLLMGIGVIAAKSARRGSRS
jgi:hypothetical protein